MLASELSTQPIKSTRSLSTVRTASLHDSLFDFDIAIGRTQYQRMDARRIAVGPLLPGRSAAVSIFVADSAPARQFARQGRGPNELHQLFALARSERGAPLAAVWGLGVVKLFNSDGTVSRSVDFGSRALGVAECRSEVHVLSGVMRESGAVQGGVYAVRAGQTQPDLVHPIPIQRNTELPAFPQLLDARGGRLVAAVTNRSALFVSDTLCRRFRVVALDLPWFVTPDSTGQSLPWEGPVPPKILGVRWYSEQIVSVLLQRANPEARYFSDPKSRSSPRAPAGLVIPLSETVLLLVDARSGGILADAVLDRSGWSFVSGREIVGRRIDDELATMDIWSFQLDPDQRESSAPIQRRPRQ